MVSSMFGSTPPATVPGLEVMDAVQQGTAQVSYLLLLLHGKNPALAFDTCVLFGLNARQQTAWLLKLVGSS